MVAPRKRRVSRNVVLLQPDCFAVRRTLKGACAKMLLLLSIILLEVRLYGATGYMEQNDGIYYNNMKNIHALNTKV